MVIWTARHRAFIVEAFFKSGDSVITTQCLFRRESNVPCHSAIPNPNTIKLILIPYGSKRMGPDLISARATMNMLGTVPEHVVSQNGNVQSPAHSLI